MRRGRSGAVVGCVLLALMACGPTRAVEELRGDVLFYPWPHAAQLPVEEVARHRAAEVRSLQEIEDFSGTLAAWVEKTGPVDRITIGPEDLVFTSHFFVYYLASFQKPAGSPKMIVRVQRRGPDGAEVLDHQESPESWMNHHAQAGGLLFSMYGMPRGEHRLRFEFLDGDRRAAVGEVSIDYHPGEAPDPVPEATAPADQVRPLS